jgi:hypothetical protein
MNLHDPIGSPIGKPIGPNFDAMTDEEIMAYLENDAAVDKFAVAHLEPEGMKYQWVRFEVFGKPDYNRLAEVEQKGWKPVPQKRHDGRFMSPGTDGPTDMDGMRLYEMSARVVRLKREQASRKAQEAVQGMNEQLIFAPPGTAPRDAHAKTKPYVRRESGSMPMVVE